MRKLYILGLVAVAVLIIGLAWAEQFTLSTYYPAPYGVYREMRSIRMAIGDNFHKGGDYPWDEDGFPLPLGPEEIHQDADLIVEGNVGIGTITPNTDFTIHRAGGAIMDLEVNNDNIGEGEVLGEIQFRALESTFLHRTGAKITAVADGPWSNTSAEHAEGRLEFYTQSDQDGDGLADPRMVIDSNGNVGIGTTSPTTDANPNGGTTGNLDVNDVWLRAANSGTGGWASARGFSPASYSGEESITFPNSLIMKMGHVADAGALTTVTFGTPFPNAVISVVITGKDDSSSSTSVIDHATGVSTTGFKMRRTGVLLGGMYWMAMGY